MRTRSSGAYAGSVAGRLRLSNAHRATDAALVHITICSTGGPEKVGSGIAPQPTEARSEHTQAVQAGGQALHGHNNVKGKAVQVVQVGEGV